MTSAHENKHQTTTPKPIPAPTRQALSEQLLPSGGGGESHPSASSRFRGIRGSFRHRRQESRKTTSSTQSQPPPPPSGTIFTSPTVPFHPQKQYQRHTTDAARQPAGAARAGKQEVPGRVSQLVAPMEDMSVSYYAHKHHPWSDVGFYPVPWAQPLDMNTAKKNEHIPVRRSKPAPRRVKPDNGPPISNQNRETDRQSSTANYSSRPDTAMLVSPAASMAQLSTMSMGPRSIMIGFDGAFGRELPMERFKEHWAPISMADMSSGIIADLGALDGGSVRYHDTLNAVYEDLPVLLPSSVYRRESGPTRTAVPSRPATTTPKMPLARPRYSSRSTITDSPSDAETDPLSGAIWEDEVPGSANVPDLVPPTGSSIATDFKTFTPIDKALPDTPGLLCPGCMIGGKRPRPSSRGTPREEHRGTLQYSEERESGFCNACRNSDLVPNISRFTLPGLTDQTNRTAESPPGNQTASNETKKEVHVPIGTKSHVLDSRFRLGKTKESTLASRRRLQVEDEPLRPGSAPPRQKTRISHIAECQISNASPLDVVDGSDSDYGEPSPASGTMQQFGALPSHFSLGGDGSIQPLRLLTKGAEGNMMSPNPKFRRSIRGNSVVVNEINGMIEDWEADIFKDYGALSPIDTSKALVSPSLSLLEKSLVNLKRHTDMSSLKSADLETVTPRTRFYNHHKRANGDF
ncbi:hypothetical protein PFICI_09443 [Pestalotiopsis fici W106-1]|uniref:Uncharacterized protein n=1 Tax=Pestalotiopsis fici (strain W106-1 / CGMCC3.15140) TaxID=1229662 RepID=W3X0G5_PESFW|nr:uncharacterized protein PFICI_09443 [Pestalotiopsis fici W106-1]ETS79590.1 hypothetical protein PFICI_09443 [Pestalotiopsis fici W106-1]